MVQLEEAPRFGRADFLLLTKRFEAEGEASAPAAERTRLKAGQPVPPRTRLSELPGDAPVRAQHGPSPLLDLRPSGQECSRAQSSPSSRLPHQRAPKIQPSRVNKTLLKPRYSSKRGTVLLAEAGAASRFPGMTPMPNKPSPVLLIFSYGEGKKKTR